MRKHLKLKHGLATKELQSPYVPEKLYDVLAIAGCPLECSTVTPLHERSQLSTHLRGPLRMSKEEASAIVESLTVKVTSSERAAHNAKVVAAGKRKDVRRSAHGARRNCKERSRQRGTLCVFASMFLSCIASWLVGIMAFRRNIYINKQLH